MNKFHQLSSLKGSEFCFSLVEYLLEVLRLVFEGYVELEHVGAEGVILCLGYFIELDDSWDVVQFGHAGVASIATMEL